MATTKRQYCSHRKDSQRRKARKTSEQLRGKEEVVPVDHKRRAIIAALGADFAREAQQQWLLRRVVGSPKHRTQ